MDIYSAVLDSVRFEGGKLGKASPTRVAHRANIPYDRFQKILEHFIESGLVGKTSDGLLLTDKGLKCLQQIHQINDFLKGMGLII